MLASFGIAVKTHPVLVLAKETNGFGSSDELFYACVNQCGIGCIGSVLRFVYAEPEDDLNVSWKLLSFRSGTHLVAKEYCQDAGQVEFGSRQRP